MSNNATAENTTGDQARDSRVSITDFINVQNSITAAICAQLVLDTPRQFGSGVQRPLEKKWYDPVLERLEGEGIAMKEACELIHDIPSAKL